jgi:uncharacterized cupredoxin-like copper-binding protein
MPISKRTMLFAAVAGLVVTAGRAIAHGDETHPKAGPLKKEQKDWGIAGEAAQAKRTIAVQMLDTMRFVPERIDVKQGETIRFTARNTGKVLHEFVIGTMQENEKHAALMLKFPTMEHSEPYMAHVPPGEVGQIVWTLNRPGEFEFACLIAGHYQSGMRGKIMVSKA